ncbi:MAG: sugar ABC transporter permease [Chloroflexi bacterium]|nr:sugar ABC transporter permease [Chloroflexota bacterium]
MATATRTTTRRRTDREGMVMPNRRRNLIIRLVLLILGCIFALYPVLLILGASFDPRDTLSGARIIPENPSLVNYQTLFSGAQTPILRWLMNSIIVSSISTVIVLALTVLAAYSLSRFRFSGRRTTLLATLVIQVFPIAVSLVAFYLLLDQIGEIVPWLGLNTLGGLIILYCGGALGANAFLMKGYFDTIPRDIDESAKVDGASEWQTFAWIILPLIRPILAVVGILTFIGTFNDYLIPRVLLRDTQVFTLAVGLTTYIGNDFSQDWGVFTAGAIIGVLPITIAFIVLQTQIIGGLAQGAVKG